MDALLPNTSQLLNFCADSCSNMQQNLNSPNLQTIWRLVLTILTGLLTTATVNSQNVIISAPADVPGDASQTINHNFPSFAVEKSSWYEYAGTLTFQNYVLC